MTDFAIAVVQMKAPDADNVDGQGHPRAYRLIAFDQRSHRRDVAQPDFGSLTIDRGDGAAHQPLPRLADALIALGLDPAAVGQLAGFLARHRLAEDIALHLADTQFPD